MVTVFSAAPAVSGTDNIRTAVNNEKARIVETSSWQGGDWFGPSMAHWQPIGKLLAGSDRAQEKGTPGGTGSSSSTFLTWAAQRAADDTGITRQGVAFDAISTSRS